MIPHRKLSGSVLATVAALFPLALAAQDVPAATEGAPAGAAPTAPVVSQEGAAPEKIDTNEKISLIDYQDTEIRTIVREIADLRELNVLIPDTLQGSTSLKLRNVSWREVFEIVLSQVDFTYIESNNIVRIVSRASLGAEPARIEVVNLQFAKATDIQAILTPMLTGPGERVQVDARTNALILTVGQTKGNEVKSIVNRLDQEPGDAKQVLIDTKFIEANVNDVKNIGVNWSSLSGYNVKAGPFSQSYDRTVDSGKSSSANNQSNSSSTLTNGTTSSLSGTSGSNASPSGYSQTTTSDTSLGSVADRLSSVTGATSMTRAASAVFSAPEFNLVLSALKTSNNVRLMSNPTVVSLTNEEARINVTTKYPIILTTSTPGASGSQITETKQDEEYGISLRVTPQIRPQGLISLSITPEVSNLDGFNTGASGNKYPIISRRTVTNRVNLRDGYTIALGGLVQSQTSKQETKVPILGDIPGLGRLFRSNSDTADSRNLIVFITARVIDPAGNMRGSATQENFDSMLQETMDPRLTRQMNIERFDLPGFRPQMSTFATEDEAKALEEAKKAQEEGKSKSSETTTTTSASTGRAFIK